MNPGVQFGVVAIVHNENLTHEHRWSRFYSLGNYEIVIEPSAVVHAQGRGGLQEDEAGSKVFKSQTVVQVKWILEFDCHQNTN